MSCPSISPRSGAVPLLALLVSAAFGGLPTAAVNAAEVVASSCQAADVQQALNNAPDQATVRVPAGTCDWGSSSVSFAQQKSVWLRGGGSSGSGATLIKRSGAPGSSFALDFDCSKARRVELSDFRFQGRHTSVQDGGVRLRNGCRDFKVHDMAFDGFTASALEVRDVRYSDPPYSRGVIYKSRFTNSFNPAVPNQGLGYGVVVYGSATDIPLELGTAEAVFIEDNYFEANRHSVASSLASRYVVRYNQFVTVNTTRNTSMIDAHGAKRDDTDAGSRSWEVYGNHLTYRGDDYQGTGIAMRGGDGVVFDNLIDYEGSTELGIAHTLRLELEADCPTYAEPPQQVPGLPRPVRGQTVGAWIWNNERVWPGGSNNDDREIYLTNGSSFDCRYYFREGQEYFFFPKPGYQPFTYPHPLRGAGDDVIFDDDFEESN